jgi:hypothetical protein
MRAKYITSEDNLNGIVVGFHIPNKEADGEGGKLRDRAVGTRRGLVNAGLREIHRKLYEPYAILQGYKILQAELLHHRIPKRRDIRS